VALAGLVVISCICCRKGEQTAPSFFEYPLWRRFHGRQIWVLSLSEPEHRLRDARALLCLRDFLPAPAFGQCTYATVTINSGAPPDYPRSLSVLGW
jgi:hypothetical protein